MYKRFRKIIPVITRNAGVLTLACILLFGYLVGTFLAAETPISYFTLMRSAANSPVSIVGSLVSAFLPFLLAFAAVYYGKPSLLYFILFCKAIAFAHCSMCCCLAFGSSSFAVFRHPFAACTMPPRDQAAKIIKKIRCLHLQRRCSACGHYQFLFHLALSGDADRYIREGKLIHVGLDQRL